MSEMKAMSICFSITDIRFIRQQRIISTFVFMSFSHLIKVFILSCALFVVNLQVSTKYKKIKEAMPLGARRIRHDLY